MSTATSILRGTLGIIALLGITYLLSSSRKSINWRLVVSGIIIQLMFAILVLRVSFIESIFERVSAGFVKIIGFTQFGTEFLFKSFATGQVDSSLMNFAFNVLPTIVFFSALTSLLYYWGILQRVVWVFAWVVKKGMGISGAESLAAVGNIFLGQTEAPLLIKPYLEKMTRSEIMALMTGGMATIAGGVMASYIGFLGGSDPQQRILFAKHLLTASVLSAPASLMIAKMLIPEKEKINRDMKISREKLGSNPLEAIANGTSDGLKLAINVGAMLLVFTALIYMGNYGMERLGAWTGLNTWIASNTDYRELSFQFIVGYACAPIAWLIGVDWGDAVMVGQLIGEKTILNEFYAYVTLGNMKAEGILVSQKSIIIATYALCGFSNFASIGIQIGGIGALAPTRKGMLSELGVKALIGGTLTCLLTGAIAGMFL
jgi:CNT family concentrative nucleoside transporter